MRKLCPHGWSYNEEKAKEYGIDEGYYISDSKIAIITPEDAMEIFNYHNYEFNRSFDAGHSVVLAEVMQHAPQISIAVQSDNYPVIVNGQHQLWAIVQAGKSMQANVVIYQVRNKAAMVALFGTFDANKKRSLNVCVEVAKREGSISDEVGSRHARWSQATGAAENGFVPIRRASLNEKTRRACRPDVIAFSAWLESHIENAAQAKILGQGVAAAMFAIFVSDKIRGTNFLKKLLTGIGITDKNDPVGKLRERLTINKPQGEHGSTVCKLHAQYVYAAWRRFCLGESLMALRPYGEIPLCTKWKINLSTHERAANIAADAVEYETADA